MVPPLWEGTLLLFNPCTDGFFISNELSGKRQLNSGVPQGSVLGPILLLYVNDINMHVDVAACNLYADDTLVYCCSNTINDLQECTHTCVSTIHEWYENNRLVINASKSSIMVVTTKQRVAFNNLRVSKSVGHLAHVWSYGVRKVVSSNPDRGNIVGWVFSSDQVTGTVFPHLNMPLLPNSEFI